MQVKQCTKCDETSHKVTNATGFEIQDYTEAGWVTQKPAEFTSECCAKKALEALNTDLPKETAVNRRVYISLEPFVKKRATDFM